MPGLDAYAALAPFQIEELVDAANSILRDRPRLRVSKRTVRYYVSQGVLPAPRGAPKFARYGMEHLAKLVGARAMQDEGQSLEEVGEALRQAFRSGEASGVARIQRLLAAAPESQGYVAEQIDAYVGETPQGPLMDAPTRRFMRSCDRADAAPPVFLVLGKPVGGPPAPTPPPRSRPFASPFATGPFSKSRKAAPWRMCFGSPRGPSRGCSTRCHTAFEQL